MDEQTINIMYQKLEQAREDYQTRAEYAISIRFDLEDEKRKLRLAGAIVGKNETEREDSAASQLPTLYKQLRTAEEGERFAKYQLENALADVERLRLLIRVEEVAAKQPV